MNKKILMILAALMMLSSAYLKTQACVSYLRGDFNDDGAVNGTKIQEIINIIVKGE